VAIVRKHRSSLGALWYRRTVDRARVGSLIRPVRRHFATGLLSGPEIPKIS
jgi:hypothetical protein